MSALLGQCVKQILFLSFGLVWILPQGVAAQEALAPGEFGKAIDFRRAAAGMIGSQSLVKTPFTVELIVKLDSKSGFNILLANEPKASSSHWELYSFAKTGHLSAYLPGSGTSHVKSTEDICDGEWHLVAMQMSPDRIRLFVDGQKVADQEVEVVAPENDGSTMAVGRLVEGGIGCDGVMDTLRIRQGLHRPQQDLVQDLAMDQDTLALWDFSQVDDEGSFVNSSNRVEKLILIPAVEIENQSADSGQQANSNTEKITGHWGEDAIGFRWTEDDSVDGRWQGMDKGPFLATGLQVEDQVVLKGLVVSLDSNSEGAICYDTSTMTPRAMWGGEFIRTEAPRYGLIRHPRPGGPLTWRGIQGSAWGDQAVHYQALWPRPQSCVLGYTVNGIGVLEAPEGFSGTTQGQCLRTLQVEAHEQPLEMTLAHVIAGSVTKKQRESWTIVSSLIDPQSAVAFRFLGSNPIPEMDFVTQPGQAFQTLKLVLPKSQQAQQLQIVVGNAEDLLQGDALLGVEALNFDELQQPGPLLWGEPLETQGSAGEVQAGLRMDVISVPFDNPHRALMFLSGIDFFENGTAAICTVHGDVWLVDGLDREMERVTWRRYATGLYQPLGLRIVDQQVHVLGKDQITRLQDRDGNGEADLYINFNNQGSTSAGTHDYATCLEVDRDGNFYYARGNTGIERVSKDGSRHEVIATGLRNPNGMGLGPNGLLTAAPQEGEWTPASNIAVVKEQGHYGYRGPQPNANRPLGYDRPMIWLPRLLDNSSGGQVWLPEEGWGPLNGAMIHLSFGRCWPLLVLPEKIQGDWQAGAIRLPFQSRSGLCRGAVHPGTGELYLTGLKGWASASVDDGSLVRLSPVSNQISLPIRQEILANGLILTFGDALDESTVQDPNNWSAEQWNYRYAADYGSADYKVSAPGQQGHDEVEIKSVTLLQDRRQVFIEIPKIQPVMQLAISYRIADHRKRGMDQTVYLTLHHLGEKTGEPGPHAATIQLDRFARPRREELETGLILRLSQQRIDGGFERDVRVNRFAALELDGLHVSPTIEPRELKAIFEGWLYVDRSQPVDFHGFGAGSADLSVNDQVLIAETHPEKGESTWSGVLLEKGLNRLELTWDTPKEPTAGFQLMWSSIDFEREPIPSNRWFHDPSNPGLVRAKTERLARGDFARFQCYRCHQLSDDILKSPQRMTELDFEAPSLSRVGKDLKASWLYHWIMNPHSLDAQSEMPTLFDPQNPEHQETVSNLVAFLRSKSQLEEENAKDRELNAETNPSQTKDEQEAGEYLFEEIGCIACHQLHNEVPNSSRISLQHVEQKYTRDSIRAFLKNPSRNQKHHRMPAFHLDDSELNQLSAFLLSLGNDHELAEVEEGHVEEGEKAFVEYGCANCHSTHNSTDNSTRAGRWSVPAISLRSDEGCLRSADSKAKKSASFPVIPDFNFEEPRRERLSQWVDEQLPTLAYDSPEERAERWFQDLRCYSCHQRDGRGGELAEILFDESIQGLTPERLPDLSWAGDKFNEKWLGQFLAEGSEKPLRPWLRARMPMFSEYGHGIARGWHRQHAPSTHSESTSKPENLALAELGKPLLGQLQGFDCRQCHALGRMPATGDQKTQVALGINLLDAADRLKYGYYRRWMLDPLRIDPLTKMPRYSEDRKTTKVTEVLNGEAMPQFDAIWLYLQHLRHEGSHEGQPD